MAALTLPELWGMALGSVLALVTGIYSLRQLLLRLGQEHRICRMVEKMWGGRLGRFLTPRPTQEDS
jgi:hypothetical protein